MKTNLIFKRQEIINGVTKVVTKIVPVDIPNIKSGAGWTLSGHTDIVEIVSIQEAQEQELSETTQDKEPLEKSNIVKFNSTVGGTAKLVRSKGAIKIVARQGKSTYNQTTPNSVCINDFTKNEFFKNCREYHGNNGVYAFKMSDGRLYDYWNTIIDKEYERQHKEFLKTLNQKI